MVKCTIRSVVSAVLLLGGFAEPGTAQEITPDDLIEQIRGRREIGAADQGRIAQWVEAQVSELAGAVGQDPYSTLKTFREKVNAQYGNRENTPQFQAALAEQTAQVGAAWFAKDGLDATIARSLATVLADFNRVETLDGLLVGLKAKDASTRFLGAKALAALKTAIGTNAAQLDRTIQALREAGLVESDAVVLGRIYLALAYPNQVDAVFGVYLDLFEKRLSSRRGTAVIVDGAEIDAFDYFRGSGVFSALNTNRKAQLVGKLAVFLRLDAERYHTDKLKHYELTVLERRLDGVGAILSAVVGGPAAGGIRAALENGGHTQREQVLQQAYAWVGKPGTDESGVLNQDPWNVPVGAP